MLRVLSLASLLALTLTVAAPAATARDGMFRGFKAETTDAAFAVKFRVAKNGRTLTLFRAKMPATCPDGTTIPIEVEDTKIPVSAKGRFTFGYSVSGVGDATATGRITGTRASGTAEYGDGACGGEMRWTASRVSR